MAKKKPLIRIDFKGYIMDVTFKMITITFYLSFLALIIAVIKATHLD